MDTSSLGARAARVEDEKVTFEARSIYAGRFHNERLLDAFFLPELLRGDSRRLLIMIVKYLLVVLGGVEIS